MMREEGRGDVSDKMLDGKKTFQDCAANAKRRGEERWKRGEGENP